MKRYSHGVIRWDVDPDFEESPDGDVVLYEDAAAIERDRDEWKARAEAAEQAQSTAALFNQNLLRQRAEAESELATLHAHLATATELLRIDDALWSEWRASDITEDEDRWVSFTDRAHAHHDKVVAFLANQPAEVKP